MAKKLFQSQWDFGPPAPSAPPAREVLTVSQLTVRVRNLLERSFGEVWVSGEVTNLRAQSSGHLYFSLKDPTAQLSCVVFRGDAPSSRGLLADGREVVLQGELTVYEPRGQYQLLVHRVELQGQGALQIAFERLKQKLQAEGLFAPERKRPLPRFPERIGVVTSPTGAALQDVLHVVERRYPALELVLAPCRVQGEGAATEIAAAIQSLDRWHASATAAGGAGLDLILVTRGGGSLEDLWAFNEETVARAVHASTLPVVSAVGHEIDFTICDFVADLRAATPSAAAELITEGAWQSRQFVDEAALRLRQRARFHLRQESQRLDDLADRLGRAHPRACLERHRQRLGEVRSGLLRAIRHREKEAAARWRVLEARWSRLRPGLVVARHRDRVTERRERLAERAARLYEGRRQEWLGVAARLHLLSPLAVLARGYSITTDEATGAILRDANQARAGHTLATRLHRGVVRSVVSEPAPPARGSAPPPQE